MCIVNTLNLYTTFTKLLEEAIIINQQLIKRQTLTRLNHRLIHLNSDSNCGSFSKPKSSKPQTLPIMITAKRSSKMGVVIKESIRYQRNIGIVILEQSVRQAKK
uniref:Uncharacterized protein n=1 Tax=Glossina pallidipes TaxID=7398 RepID=A0A1A9ZNS7_GLOPL